jgi:hypothetical protein
MCRRLIFVFPFLLFFFVPRFASAATVTYTDAMAQCQAFNPKATYPGVPITDEGCTTNAARHYVCRIGVLNGSVQESCPEKAIAQWAFTGDVPPPDCSSVPPYSGAFRGKLLAGSLMCSPQSDGAGCVMKFTPDSPSFQLNGGDWGSHGSYSATGDSCAPSDDPNGSNSPPPGGPSVTCRGGSCYDAGNHQYCAVDATGKQYCIPATTVNGGGGCASSGDHTICGGSPPPLPPKPPASPISDPPTEINSSDHYLTADPVTGSNNTTIINNYGAGGSPSTSGQTSGDDGPAPSSSSPTNDHGSASGGADCNTPPVCTGDAPTCMVVSQQWLTRCKPDWYDKDGDGEPDWVGKGLDLPGVSDPDQVDPTSVVSSEDVSTDGLDDSGWAGNQCPVLPKFEFFGQEVSYGDQDTWCNFLAVLRPIFLLVAAFVSVRILASGGKS